MPLSMTSTLEDESAQHCLSQFQQACEGVCQSLSVLCPFCSCDKEWEQTCRGRSIFVLNVLNNAFWGRFP